MTKLLGHQLKENIKDVIPWIIIPFLASIGLNFLNSFLHSRFLEFIVVLSVFLFYLSFAISMVVVIVNDYKRFYGKYAAFFDILPIKSSQITIARIINIVIMSILAFVLFIVGVLGFILISANIRVTDLLNFFKMMGKIVFSAKTFTIFSLILAIVSQTLATLTRILASISIGSDKNFKNLGKFGPVIVFIIISLIVSALGLGLGFILMPESYNSTVNVVLDNSEGVMLLSDILDGMVKLIMGGALLNIVVFVIQVYLTNFFHKNRLSVQ